MAEFVINAEIRKELGKGASKRLRRRGLIPAVFYGRGEKPLAISVDPRPIKQLLHSASGHNTIITLSFDGRSTQAIIKAVQYHPVRDELLHADFLHVAMDVAIRVTVPIELVGEARGVKAAGGILELVRREIEVECLPGDIPDHIRIDVSELGIGDTVHVADLNVDRSRLKILEEPDTVLATVIAPRVEEEKPEAVVAEPAEPEVIKKGKGEETEEKA